jgi:hypothetical protein
MRCWSPLREVASHAVELARQGIAFSGRRVRVETLCLHGDHPHAAENARAVHDALREYGIEPRRLVSHSSAITITLSSGVKVTSSDFLGLVRTPYALPESFESEAMR